MSVERNDDDQYLFDTWIHPVLDLSGIRLTDLKPTEPVASLFRYLREALAERDATTRHLAADEIRAETQKLRDHQVLEPDKFRPCRDAADQVHPVHGDEADCTDFTPSS